MTLTDIYHAAGATTYKAALRVIGKERVLFMDGKPVGHVLSHSRSELMCRQGDGSYRGVETNQRLRRRAGIWRWLHSK